MRSWGLYPLTGRNGMSLADFNELVDRAGAELEQLPLKPYLVLYVFEAGVSRSATLTQRRYICWGRKPLSKTRVEKAGAGVQNKSRSTWLT
jgi:hypothetical protein